MTEENKNPIQIHSGYANLLILAYKGKEDFQKSGIKDDVSRIEWDNLIRGLKEKENFSAPGAAEAISAEAKEIKTKIQQKNKEIEEALIAIKKDYQTLKNLFDTLGDLVKGAIGLGLAIK